MTEEELEQAQAEIHDLFDDIREALAEDRSADYRTKHARGVSS
jgi:hypothetical protein